MDKDDWLCLAFLLTVGVIVNTVASDAVYWLAYKLDVSVLLVSMFAVLIPGLIYILVYNKLHARRVRKHREEHSTQ